MPDSIYVDFEYGDLKEVIVERGVMRYPDVEHAAWAAEGIKIIPKAEAEKAWHRSAKNSRDLPKYELLEAENAELIAVLKRFGVTVHRPEEITDKQVAANYGTEWLVNGYMQAYSCDPIFVVGNNVIELVLGAPNRRAELLGYRKLFLERVLGSGARWFQMPLADVTAIGGPDYSKEAFPTLEGVMSTHQRLQPMSSALPGDAEAPKSRQSRD